MHDPDSLVCRLGPFSLWHHDPCTDGTDDSCGSFMRARHGDKAVLETIIRDFEFEWDRTYSPSRSDHDEEDGPFTEHVYFQGLFKTDGMPNLSCHGIVLNLFQVAAWEVFGHSRRKVGRFMRKHLYDILMFAENPVDSLFDGLTLKYERGCHEAHTPKRREERIRRMAGCIYAFILRAERPWWKAPRWHVHHWRLTCAPFWRRRKQTAKA